MARIRVLKVSGQTSKLRPKIMFFHNDNFDKYTRSRNGKYNVMVVNRDQKSRYLDNQIRAYSDKIRFHTQGT